MYEFRSVAQGFRSLRELLMRRHAEFRGAPAGCRRGRVSGPGAGSIKSCPVRTDDEGARECGPRAAWAPAASHLSLSRAAEKCTTFGSRKVHHLAAGRQPSEDLGGRWRGSCGLEFRADRRKRADLRDDSLRDAAAAQVEERSDGA